jgi:hypothetical protein
MHAESLSAQYRAEADELRAELTPFLSGEHFAYRNQVDVTGEHVTILRRAIAELERCAEARDRHAGDA